MDTTEEHPEAIITITGAPIPLLNLEGHLISFNADPLADQAWADLVGMQAQLNALDPTKAEDVQHAHTELKRILSEFIVDGKPFWNKSKALGFKHLTEIMYAYVKKVTDGIPT